MSIRKENFEHPIQVIQRVIFDLDLAVLLAVMDADLRSEKVLQLFFEGLKLRVFLGPWGRLFPGPIPPGQLLKLPDGQTFLNDLIAKQELLFGIPLVWGCLITVADVMLVLLLQNKGFRYLEAVVLTLILTIGTCFTVELFLAKPDVGGVLAGLVPTAVGEKRRAVVS